MDDSRGLTRNQLSYRQLWQDVDLHEVLDACERYLELAPLTEDRTVLMALVLHVRALKARLEVP